MIKKLQTRFILIAMGAVAIVLFILMGSINLSNYNRVVSESDHLLLYLAENGGQFPKPGNEPDTKMSNTIPNRQKPPRNSMSAEAPFETRFFTISFDTNGDAIRVNTGSIAAIDPEAAIKLANKIYLNGESNGFYNYYRYHVSRTSDGVMVSFLDCSRNLDAFYAFLKTSLFVSLIGIAGVFIIVLILSGKAIKPISESYNKQKRFITDASHELRTPLTVISANTEVIEMTEGESEWTKSIRNQVEKLAKLTKDLVELTRMDENTNHLIMTEFNLSDAVMESIAPFEVLAKQKNQSFHFHIQEDISYHGHEESIRKLFMLFADNAVKYASENSEIMMRLEKKKKNIVFETTNQVDEIKKGDQSTLFDRFYRADSSRNSATGGYGIGLSIAKAIVINHKGKITAKSVDGHSLTITVLLS